MGPSCSFNDLQFNEMYDSPQSSFYEDGLIASSVSPRTWLPVIGNAPVTPTPTPVPVKVSGFSNISSFSLSFKYDPAVLTLPPGAFTPNPIFGGTMVVNDLPPGTDGKRRITLSWTGSPTTLSDNSQIISFNFNGAAGGGTQLKWNTGGDSCQYMGQGLKVLWNQPVSNFYQDGIVAHHLSPVTQAAVVTKSTGQPVTVPVTVSNFTNIGIFSLTLYYDPGVLTYQSATLAPPIGGVFSVTNSQPGRLDFNWSGGPAGLSDGSVLLNLGFYFTGGTSALQWQCNGSTCGYSEGGSSPLLYDLPKNNFYINGSVSGPLSNLNAHLKVFLEGPYSSVSGTMGTGLGAIIPLTQPYSGSPWNYAGTEQVSAIPANTTDWILVELRTDPWSSSKVATRAGFLRNDGVITEIDGTTDLSFPGITFGSYYLVIYHRNHLAIMSSTAALLNAGSAVYDFTTGSGLTYGGASGYKKIDLVTNKWGMIAGDANQSKNVYIDDYTDYWIPKFGLHQYLPGDFNLDGNVFLNDYTDYWLVNFGRSSSLP
jgi:hypothetical protein